MLKTRILAAVAALAALVAPAVSFAARTYQEAEAKFQQQKDFVNGRKDAIQQKLNSGHGNQAKLQARLDALNAKLGHLNDLQQGYEDTHESQ